MKIKSCEGTNGTRSPALPAMESEAKAGRPQYPRGRTVFPACLAPEGKQSRPPNAASSHWEPSTEQQRACEVVA